MMTRWRLWIGLSALTLFVSEHALGDDATEAARERALQNVHFSTPLTQSARERLVEGQGLPVIVTLHLPDASQVDPLGQGPDLAGRQRLIRNAQDEVLLDTFGAGLEEMRVRAAYDSLNERSLARIDQSFSVVPGFSAVLNLSDIAALQQHALVNSIHEDQLSTPLLNESTALIGAPVLWSQGFEGQGGAVAVLDTGVEKDHPMVGPAITASACFSSTVADQSTSLCPDGSEEIIDMTGGDAGDACLDSQINADQGTAGCDHGTHVASIAAGRSVTLSSGRELSGVARSANIVAINVFSRFPPSECEDDGQHCAQSYTSDQIQALEWVYANRQQLNISSVNMSLGGGEYSSACLNDPLRPIIQALSAQGIATVIASGNESFTGAVSSPSCIPEAITVGATDKQDSVASFSNSSESLDLLAPGVGILAALLTEEPAAGENCVINDTDPGEDGVCHWFGTKGGTSMAAPHVAGAFTLLSAAVPGASVNDMLAALNFTGAQILGGNGITRSRIQIDAAYRVLQQGGVFAENVQLAPVAPFRTSGNAGSSGSFSTVEYTLTNRSGAARTVTVAEKPAWIALEADSFVIGDGSAYVLRLSVDMTGLPQNAAVGQVRLQVGTQSISIPVSIRVARELAYAEFGPFEWTGDAAAATQSIFRIAGLRNGLPSRIEVAVGRSARGIYSSDYSDCELVVRPENYRNQEYVITSTDLATCGAFGRADLSFRLTVDSQDKLLGLRLRRFGVRASGALTDFAFDNQSVSSSAADLQRNAVVSIEATGAGRLRRPVLIQGEGADRSEEAAYHTELTNQAASLSQNEAAAAASSPGTAEFGPFEWAGDANAPTVSIFRISGVTSSPPRLIEVAVGEAYLGGYGGVFSDCTLTVRPDRHSGQEYVIFNSDLAECGNFGRANLSFRITPNEADPAGDIKMRRFAVNLVGGLTDFGFDQDQQSAPVGTDVGGGLRQYVFGPFEWTGDSNAVASNVFRLSGVGGGRPESIEVSIANAAQPGFNGSFNDCTLPINGGGAGAWEYVFSNADFVPCGSFGRADLTFRVTMRAEQVGRLVQLRRFALWGNDLTDFGFDGQRGQGSGPQPLDNGSAFVEFGPFDWTGDRNAGTQSSFRISGLKAAPIEIRVALDNSATSGSGNGFEDCILGSGVSGFSGGEYLITGNDLAACGDFVRADIRFRITAAVADFEPVVRMRRFAITGSGGITDFGFDNR